MKSVRSEIENNVRMHHISMPDDDEKPKREMKKAELQMAWEERIQTMPLPELLRFAHPDDRSRLASKAIEEGILTKEEGKEFIRFVR